MLYDKTNAHKVRTSWIGITRFMNKTYHLSMMPGRNCFPVQSIRRRFHTLRKSPPQHSSLRQLKGILILNSADWIIKAYEDRKIPGTPSKYLAQMSAAPNSTCLQQRGQPRLWIKLPGASSPLNTRRDSDRCFLYQTWRERKKETGKMINLAVF